MRVAQHAGQPKLVVVPHGTLPYRGSGAHDQVLVSKKTLSGMLAYQERWAGPVEMVTVGSRTDDSSNLGASWTDRADLPFPLHVMDSIPQVLASMESIRPSVILAPHHTSFSGILSAPWPVALLSENPTSEAMVGELAAEESRVNRARIRAGGFRKENELRKMVKRAAGLQCNGWASWIAYANYSRSAVLFYDTRLSEGHVSHALSSEKGYMGGDLRLAFSGRLILIKGPEHVLEADRLLTERGVGHTLTIIGAGPLEPLLRERAAPTVSFLKPMDFDSQWVPWIRDNVDLMVLPHIVGDPSGTFLEAAGLGVPLLGFDGMALKNLVDRYGIGWTVPRGDSAALADVAGDLARSPSRLEAAGRRGLDFMAEHHFEHEFDLRIEHLLALARY